jgi:hypothetical protein
MKDTTSVLKGMTQRRSEASYVTLISQSIFKHQVTSSSTTTKLTLASGWRTTASCVERAERTMISSSSNSFPSTWPILTGPGWIICQETLSIAGKIYEKSSLATSREHTFVLATRGTYRAASKSQASPSEITSGVSHKSVMSFLLWPTLMSSQRSGTT